MADSTIAGLAELTGAIDGTNDSVPVWDASAATTKFLPLKSFPVMALGAVGGRNILANSDENTIATDVHTCTIAGGGGTGAGEENNISGSSSHYATISGGYDNDIDDAVASVIAGGAHHSIDSGATHGVISGGSTNNIISGDYCTIAGGTTNDITGSTSSIGGGNTNSITATSSLIAGGNGNTVSDGGTANTICGGNGNTISGATTNYATVSGGQLNTVSAAGGAVVGGQSHTSSGVNAICSGGTTNVASGLNAACIGGDTNLADGISATAFGSQAKSSIQGGVAWTGRKISAQGDAQSISFTQSQQTTDATITSLSSYGAANYAPIPDNSAWAGRAYIVGRESATGDVCAYELLFCCERDGGTASKADSATATEIVNQNSIAGAAPVLNIHSTGLFRIQVTGTLAKTINWCATVTAAQVVGT